MLNHNSDDLSGEPYVEERKSERHGIGNCMHVGVATAALQSARIELRLPYFCLENKNVDRLMSVLFSTLKIHFDWFQIDDLRVLSKLEIDGKTNKSQI